MALLVDSGRIGLATALKAQTMYFAWGRGDSWWGATDVVTKTFSGAPDQFTLDHTPVASVIVRDPNSAQVFATPADYVFDTNSGIVTRVNGGAIAPGATVQVQVVYGSPQVASGNTSLESEIGRRIAAEVDFVVSDANGNLSTPDGSRWTVSTTPTRYLYVSVLFDFLEASTETIREVGIFVGTVAADGVPVGQLYLTPDQVKNPGYLYLLDRFAGIPRSPSSRQGFSYVLVI
jgi:hypothetical protein